MQEASNDAKELEQRTLAEKALCASNEYITDKNKYTVLLVEDDSTDRDEILRTLHKSPFVHNVHWFDSGDKMLKHFVLDGYYGSALISHLPKLILLDIRIPGSDGMQILRRLKDNPLTQDIPIIMMTGSVTEEKAAESFRLQANAFISKPLHLERLHEVMLRGWSWPKLEMEKKPQTPQA